MFDDLSDLYQQVILDHCKQPRNFRELPTPTCSAQGHNPLCGDQLKLFLAMDGEVIKDISFVGSGCCISKASASLLTGRLKGMSLEDAKQIGKDDVLEELGIEISPARIKCALLSLKVLKAGAYGLGDWPGEDEED